jgi:glutathione S-transferase
MVHYLLSENDPKTTGLEAPYIKLYTAGTPNGFKVTILLELLKLDYFVRPIDIRAAECKQDWYLKFNPNGRIPSLTYVDPKGEATHINESAAILLFIADKFDKDFKYSFPHGTKEYYEMLEWIFFQMAGLGPMKGQYHWFNFFAPEKDEFAIERYYKETLRLFGVLEERLERNKTGYLVSDHLTLADIVSYPWVNGKLRMKELDDYPRLAQWVDTISKIPEVQIGTEIPPPPKIN